jgi:hypothetical protein
MLASEIDGCVPLSVTPETLIRTLDLVMIEDARIVVTAGAKNLSNQPAQKEYPHPSA